jgi:outer membrane protein OmpA-like peptidoglycan-associated protein
LKIHFKYFTYFIWLMLSLNSFQTKAQVSTSRFSLTPHIGLGMLLPGKQTVIAGNERMVYKWGFYNFGKVLNAGGEQSLNLKTTNRIGIDLNFRVNNRIQLVAGVNRINIISSYKPTFVYSFKGQQINGIIADFNYFNFDFGFRYTGYNLYYVLKGNYIPDVNATFKKRAKADSPGAAGVFTNQNNTGLILNTVQSNDIKYGLYLGIGQGLMFGGGNTELEVGYSFANVPLYKEEVKFINNGNQIGSVRINNLINTFFISINQPFEFRKKSKIQKLKIEKANQAKPSAQIGQSRIKIGEDLVLNSVEFEQSSAELTSENQADLLDILAFMQAYPKSKIEISGHTSAEGDRTANIELSEKRALACKTYLEKNGIASKRIRTLGRGPDRQISKTEPEKNRRVEMKILSLE